MSNNKLGGSPKLDFMKIGIFAYLISYLDVYSIPLKERVIMVGLLAIGFFTDWYMLKFYAEVYWTRWFRKNKNTHTKPPDAQNTTKTD